MLKINDVELEFRMTDADFYERYMENAKIMDAVINAEVSEDELREDYKKAADLMRKKCAATKAFLDNVFEEGMGDSVCGPGSDYGRCYDVYCAIVDEVREQGNTFSTKVQNLKEKQSSNRAARRSKK